MEIKAKREEFLNEMSRNGELRELKVLDINDRSKKIKEREKEIAKQERYTNKSRILAKKKKQAKIRRRRIGTLIAAGLIAFGGCEARKYYVQNMKSVTLEEALDKGKTLEELGLSQSNLNELEDIKLDLLDRDNLSKEEILELGEKIEQFELSVIKSKIKNAMGISNEIQVQPRTEYSNANIFVLDDKGQMTQWLKEGKDYDKEIGNFIENIANLQIANNGYNNGINDREEILKKYDKSLNNAERFASSEITVNKKGKIDLEKTTKASLEKENENQTQKLALLEDEGR